MPEFTTVSLQEAQMRTIPGRQGQFILYFWREDGTDEQPRTKGRYTRRGRSQEEIPAPDQPVDELGMVEQGIPAENSPELGQTEQVVDDAMRRVDPE